MCRMVLAIKREKDVVAVLHSALYKPRFLKTLT